MEEQLLKTLQSGVKLSEVYEAGINFVKKEKSKLIDNLTRNFGYIKKKNNQKNLFYYNTYINE